LKLDFSNLPDEAIGEFLGRYRLLEKIGEGGCGVVYVAEQSEPVRRRVALKVIKLGMDTRQVVARFEAERQALAMMDHPNIAKVLDAGATDTGRPYFVMELVRGVPITAYCDQNNLSTTHRINLFISVCQAIQHAHQKGIIHRDIKPTNILVTLRDGVPFPKVIDFGIAKATEGRLTDGTVYTQLHQLIGTPAYMSPEQADMSGLDTDTRSDIYSLGVVLYELLAGRTPFDAKDLMASGFDAMRRTLRDRDPDRPSTKLETLDETELTKTAQRRSSSGPELPRLLKGDLDWIVMKCLEKDRTRRYETANGLAADLRRYLANEPVIARPPSKAYRFQKALKRHRLAFSAAIAIVATLVVGITVSTWQSIRANNLKRIAAVRLAESEKSRSENAAILSFLTEVFQNQENFIGGRAGTLSETLDAAVKRLDLEFKDRPARRAEIQITLATAYLGLNQPNGATPLFLQARDYFMERHGIDHDNTIKAMFGLANSYYLAGRKDEALAMHESLVERSRRVNGPEHPTTIATLHALGASLGELRGLKFREEAMGLSRKVNGTNHPSTFKSMWNLNLSYMAVGDVPESHALREELLRAGLLRYGPESTYVQRIMRWAESAYYDVGRWKDALRVRGVFTQAATNDISIDFPALLAWFGQAEQFDDVARGFLARARQDGSLEAAERAAKAYCIIPSRDPGLLREALALGRHAVDGGNGHKFYYWFQLALGMAEYRSGNLAPAEKALAASLETAPANGEETAKSAAGLYLSMCRFRMGKKEEARYAFDAATAIMRRLPDDDFNPWLSDNGNDIVTWLAYREAVGLLGIPAPETSQVDRWIQSLRQSVTEYPDDIGRLAHLGLAQLWLGNGDEHRDTSRRMLESVNRALNSWDYEKAARVYLLQANPEPEILKLASEASRKGLSLAKLNADDQGWFKITKALGDSRTDKLGEADSLLTDVVDTARNGMQRGLALAVRARVRWSTGRAAEARADLAEVDALAIPEPDRVRVNFVLRKADHLAVHLATREARALIKP